MLPEMYGFQAMYKIPRQSRCVYNANSFYPILMNHWGEYEMNSSNS